MIIKIKLPHYKLIFLTFLLLINLVLFSYLVFQAFFGNKFYPGIKISGQPIGGKTPSEANLLLKDLFRNRQEVLVFEYQNQHLEINPVTAEPILDIDDKLNQAYSIGRSSNSLQALQEQFQTLVFGKNIDLKTTYQKEPLLFSQIDALGLVVAKEPVNAQIRLETEITVTPSQEGQRLNKDKLKKLLLDYFSLKTDKPASLPINTIKPGFDTSLAQAAKMALEQIKISPIKLTFEKSSWVIDQPTLFSLLDLQGASKENALPVTSSQVIIQSSNITSTKVLLDPVKLSNFLDSVATKTNQPVQDAKFTFDPTTSKVSEFQASQEGKELDKEKITTLINQALATNLNTEVEVPIKTILPKITQSEASNFGINKLLGQGFSNFSGSITNRIFNVGLASSRINGTLIPPGETFSFNQTVGEVSGATGYKQAYVIKSGRTVLDDGGGVCQVSTTLFRAVLNAGLPITARTAHAYRVGYYEQGFPPGLDATVFSPTVDFKFTNNTPAHILVQTATSGTTLTIGLYGTDDGRVTSVSTPIITSQTPPLPELRQDDPTLPKGTVKQVDWPAWGANVYFKRTVTRNGEALITETWNSNYRPWQAVYLVGTREN